MLNGLEQISALFAADYNILYTAPRFEDWTCELTGSTYKDVGFGSALVYKKSLDVVKTGETMITFMTIQKGQRPLQWMVFNKSGVRYLAAHLHGVWLRENTKGDDPIRDQQSAAVVLELSEIAELFSVDKAIFGGDLNLAIDTRALRALEYDPEGVPFMKNLIREHGIQNTRTARYRKFHIAHEPMHADYAFVSDNVDVKRFEVKNEVAASDHAPLHLVFA